MTLISLVAHGPVDPALAWERYVDTRLWSSWSPQISRVELFGAVGSRIEPGLRGRVHAVGGLRVPFEVTSVDDEQMSWSWRVRIGPAAVRLDHRVTARDGGTRTTLDLHGFLPVVAGYAPVAQLALRRLVQV